jgi:hypothetical protein
MRTVILVTLLLFSTPVMAVTFTPVAPVHVAPIVHVSPTVRVNPGVHGHSMIKPGTKGSHVGTHSRNVTVVTDTSTSKKCADRKSDKGCAKK